MSVTRTTARLLAIIVLLFSVAACDDDSKKEEPEHQAEIYYSEGVKLYLREMKSERGFKKPRVHVDHTDKVDVTHEARPPRKKIVFDFAPVALSVMLILVLAAASKGVRSRRPTNHPSRTNRSFRFPAIRPELRQILRASVRTLMPQQARCSRP